MATTTKPTTSTNAKATPSGESRSKKLVPVSPERAAGVAKKRKRLAKAFPRPLDKQLGKPQTVREKFALPALEYERLLELKARLTEQGASVKKSELVRAGLMLLSALDDDELKLTLARLPANV